MYGEQLFNLRFLEELAQKLQSLDCQVIALPAPIFTITEGVNRYIYIPLGGTRNVLISSVLIFTFVALWHDLSFKLLAWGWLVSLFLVPELIARAVLPQSKVNNFHRTQVHALILALPSSLAHSGGIDMYALLEEYLTSSRC